MKLALKISSFCDLFFFIVFCILLPSAINQQLTAFWESAFIMSCALAMALSIVNIILIFEFNLNASEQQWEELITRVDKYEKLLNDKFKH